MNIEDLITLERNKANCNWISTYGFVYELAKSIDAAKILEIGVAYGYHAEYLLRHLPNAEYQGVDPYIAGYDPNDSFAEDVRSLFGGHPQQSMDRLFKAVNTTLSQYNGRGNLLRATSIQAAARFADGYFDLIYVDGNHTYDGVMADLNAWYSKVRPGGILCGDDFNWQGVRDAVITFMKEKGHDAISYSSPNSPTPEKWSTII